MGRGGKPFAQRTHRDESSSTSAVMPCVSAKNSARARTDCSEERVRRARAARRQSLLPSPSVIRVDTAGSVGRAAPSHDKDVAKTRAAAGKKSRRLAAARDTRRRTGAGTYIERINPAPASLRVKNEEAIRFNPSFQSTRVKGVCHRSIIDGHLDGQRGRKRRRDPFTREQEQRRTRIWRGAWKHGHLM